MTTRLGIVVSHPTQYYSPWFRHLAAASGLDVRVYYLWDFGITEQADAKFGKNFVWDVPLLDGYEHQLVPNVARDPGTHHFRGLDNPTLLNEVDSYDPHAILVFGYGWKSMLSLIWTRPKTTAILLRGDSHDLVYHPKTIRQRVRRAATKATLSRCQAVLAVGHANAAFYRNNGVDERCIFHAPHCVDNSRFKDQDSFERANAIRSEFGVLPNTMVVLFAGKFEAKKRPDLLVEAFRRMTAKNVELWMVGSGPMEDEVRRLAGDDSRIRFLGFRNQSELPGIFSAAKLVVLPSEGPGETWGLVVNEAMCCGCAPIVSDHVGCHPDLVHPNENGWVFQAGSLESLATSLKDAIEHPARLERFRLKSREIIGNYDYAHATDGLLRAMSFVTS